MLAFTQKLILGIIYALLSLVWVSQMITQNILDFQFEIKVDYITQLMDLLLENGYIVTTSFFIVLMTYYLLIATIKGNYSFGFKFSSPTFYPFRQNETQLTSFLVNIGIMNALSTSIIQLSCSCFFSLLQKSGIFQTFVFIKNSELFKWFFENTVFQWLLLTMNLLSLIFYLFNSGDRLRFDQLQSKIGLKEID